MRDLQLFLIFPFICQNLMESGKEGSVHMSSEGKPNDTEIKERVDAMLEQMNKGVSSETLKALSTKPSPPVNKNSNKPSNKIVEPQEKDMSSEGSKVLQNSSDDAKVLAATALSAVRDSTSTIAGRGKVEIREIRDFAGQDVEIKKFVDADSKEAHEKMKAPATSAVDAVLEQIKKKQKLSVLGKTKKDWGEFKEETKGLEEDLDAYKKSSNQYLDIVSFLQRADYREFERERDARLSLQARRSERSHD
ncbi:craniofacial development protein 1-like isoform X2 [Cucurbita moschata]|uniref:Craniofacial development protein 1-like isoform X2 n=1 Tax=Cucurbita moschata TaxID=3662 RepID=A0A6J1EQP9_CUCMO|nr:craniofacial development protein 1-like isoform X2 [Cucurbita moschata]